MVKITSRWINGVGFKAKVRHFPEIWIDEPPQFHGSDRGISSVEFMLVAISGCLGSSIAYCFRNLQVEMEGCEIEVNGKMTHPNGLPLRIVGVSARIDVTLAPGQDAEHVALCVEKFKQYCVVTQSVVRGIPADIEVNVQ